MTIGESRSMCAERSGGPIAEVWPTSYKLPRQPSIVTREKSRCNLSRGDHDETPSRESAHSSMPRHRRRFQTRGQVAAGRGDARLIQTEIGQKLIALGMLDEAIGNAEAAEVRGRNPCIGGRFEHGAAEAAHQCSFF